MKYVKIINLDKNNTFFHFSRIANRNSIERDGLQAVAGGENEEVNDKNNPTIYFSKGIEGFLKTVDVWTRWEYFRSVKNTDKEIKRGFKRYEKDIMHTVYEKLYEDFKKRQYYNVKLVEGLDFKYNDIDVKKPASRDENGIPYQGAIWTYGPYSNLYDDRQEIWNMNTVIGEKYISKDRLEIIENDNGKSDALSVILEIYEKYRSDFESIDLSVLDGFIQYALERYNKDPDYYIDMPDLGRKEPSIKEEQKYRKINKIKTIAPQCRTGLMDEAVRFMQETILNEKDKNNSTKERE